MGQCQVYKARCQLSVATPTWVIPSQGRTSLIPNTGHTALSPLLTTPTCVHDPPASKKEEKKAKQSEPVSLAASSFKHMYLVLAKTCLSYCFLSKTSISFP